MKLVIASMFLAVSAPAAGCGGGGGASCEDAVANGLRIAGMGGSQYGGMRASVVKLCVDERWSAKTRGCLAAAKSQGDVEKCPQERDGDKSSGAEEYVKKSKASEAELNLQKIGKALKMHYAETATFPTGTAAPTPAEPCCKTGGKCAPSAGGWTTDEVWTTLDFTVDDPHYFQYAYESGNNGQTAKVRAIGDLDCDGTAVEYVLEAAAPQSNPTVTLTKPASVD